MASALFAYFNKLQASPLLPSWRRAWVLKRLGLDCAVGAFTVVREGCFFGSSRVRIAPGCFINHQCYFGGDDWITLKERVHLAPRVQILTGTHDFGDDSCRAGRDRALPVIIGEGSWIGAGAMILPGVEIARGCVIAAGSVVTRSTKPNGVYAGTPAKRTRDLEINLGGALTVPHRDLAGREAS